jgi:hypothetical protein
LRAKNFSSKNALKTKMPNATTAAAAFRAAEAHHPEMTGHRTL